MVHRISLRQMKYFVAAAEFGSILTASENIHVSSPSISAAITHIESELNVQLFIRQHAKGLKLTAAGEQIRQKCADILDGSSSLYTWATERSGVIKGTLKLGCFSAFAPMLYADVVQQYSQTFEQVDVELVLDNPRRLMGFLQANQLDAALTYDLQLDKTQVAFEPLASLPPYALVSAEHPLATANSVSLETLAELPMVLLDIAYSRDYFISLFEQHELQPTIVTRSRYVEIVKTMVANEMGYSILNTRPKVNQSQDGKNLVRVPIEGNPRPMQIGIATNLSVQHTPLLQSFISHCQRVFADGKIPGMNHL